MITSFQPRPIFIGGAWQHSSEVLDVTSPSDGSLVGRTYSASAAQLDEAIAAAVRCRPTVAAMATYERSAVLRGVAMGILARVDELAELLSAEIGKPVRDARTEIERSALAFRIAGEESERISGDVIDLALNPASRGRFGLTRRFPAGVIAGIAPFNLPVSLSAHKLAPAMAVGCPIVLKVPDEAPLTMLEVAGIIEAAGAPPGSVSITPCSISVGDQLVTDERVAVLSFTGSPQVGWELKARAGKKRVVLELGGNAAAIVDRGADLAWAVKRCAQGAFKFAGQICISVQRIFVHTEVWDEFVELFVKTASTITVGDPGEPSTDYGPVIDDRAAERIRAWIAEAVEEGARLLLGDPGAGRFIGPTVIVDAPPTARVCRDEMFGPVVVLTRITDLDEGIAAVNNSRFGLQAGVFTTEVNAMWRAYAQLEVGGVIVNDAPSYRIDHMPYGGVKDSGLGREGIRYAMDDMSEPRLLVIAEPE